MSGNLAVKPRVLGSQPNPGPNNKGGGDYKQLKISDLFERLPGPRENT